MSTIQQVLLGYGGAAAPRPQDVFRSITYAGNGAARTLTIGVDIAGKGGRIWNKIRSQNASNYMLDSSRNNFDQILVAETTAAAVNLNFLNVSNTGIELLGAALNVTGEVYMFWSCRNSPRFFSNPTVTKSSGVDATVDLSSLGMAGMISVKSTSIIGSWYVFHRSATTGKLLLLDQPAAESPLGHITVSGTTLTLEDGVIADGSYVVHALAHDPHPDGIVLCDSFTTNSSGVGTYDHGWAEGAQYVELKCATAAGDWEIFDTTRSDWYGIDARLWANLYNKEDFVSRISRSGTTLTFSGLSANQTYIFTMIRAPI